MSTSIVILIVVVVVVIAAALAVLARSRRRTARFTLRSLPDESRAAFQQDWAGVQERFVDAPADAVGQAAALVNRLLAEVGYPDQEFEQQAQDLAVDHADAVEPYRRARAVLPTPAGADSTAVPAADTDTDELRRSLLDYRSVFESVLGMNKKKSGAVSGPRA
jgi:hypothetical protein